MMRSAKAWRARSSALAVMRSRRSARSASEVLVRADERGEVVVGLGQAPLAQLPQTHRELDVGAGQLLLAVVVGERDR